MPEAVRDRREVEFELRELEKMRQELGFRDVDEMNTWLHGPRFGEHFQEYAQEWIYPQQERIKQTGGVRARGPNLRTVEQRLVNGERPGFDKFSFTQPDKTDWDHVDHLAKLLYEIRRANTKSAHGVFFKKSFTESEMNHRIWILIKRQEYACAPSRRNGEALSKASSNPAPGMPPEPPIDRPDQAQIVEVDEEQESEKPPTDTAVNPPGPFHAVEYIDLTRDSLHANADTPLIPRRQFDPFVFIDVELDRVHAPTDTAVNPPGPFHAVGYIDLTRDSLHANAAPAPLLDVPPSPDVPPPPPADISPSPPPCP